MRVLQLIDSLHAGGAERLAVNYANALSKRIESSYLCCTREEGLLNVKINAEVNYFFLNKKGAVDIVAILRLYKFLKQNSINIIHAHSTSFFLAYIVKLMYPKLKIIWHDHYGESESVNKRNYKILKFCSKRFAHTIAVNHTLVNWSKKHLKVKAVSHLVNFSIPDNAKFSNTILSGTTGKRIIHLANLRAQKDHETLFYAFKTVQEKYPEWTLHCVGKDFLDEYSKSIKNLVKKLSLESGIFFYDSRSDIGNILKQSDIAVLSSKSEGLPLSLLEYGIAGLPVVSTNVGDTSLVISTPKEGILIQPMNAKLLSDAIINYITHPKLMKNVSIGLEKKISKEFSEEKVMHQLLQIYNGVLK